MQQSFGVLYVGFLWAWHREDFIVVNWISSSCSVSLRSLEQRTNESRSKVIELERTVNETSWDLNSHQKKPPILPPLLPTMTFDPSLEHGSVSWSKPHIEASTADILRSFFLMPSLLNQIHCNGRNKKKSRGALVALISELKLHWIVFHKSTYQL